MSVSLIEIRGDLRKALKLEDSATLLSLKPFLNNRLTEVVGVNFERCELSEANVVAIFDECEFKGCIFEKLTNEDGRFFGDRCRWLGSRFKNCTLKGSVIDHNLFQDCIFEGVKFLDLVLRESCFRNVTFTNCKFKKLRFSFNSRNQTRRAGISNSDLLAALKELDRLRTSVIFQDCRFDQPEFRQASFANSYFQSTQVRDPVVQSCEFEGIAGEPDWWSSYVTTKKSVKAVVVAMVEQLFPDDAKVQARIRQCADQQNDARFAIDWLDILIECGATDSQIDEVEKALAQD